MTEEISKGLSLKGFGKKGKKPNTRKNTLKEQNAKFINRNNRLIMTAKKFLLIYLIFVEKKIYKTINSPYAIFTQANIKAF